MSINVTLGQLTTLNNTSILGQSNTNFNTIQTALTDAVSRSGQSPNAMESSLDMNSNQIINLPAPGTVNSPARLIDVTSNPTIQVPPTGTSGHTVPYLDGNNTYSGTSTFTNTVTLPAGTVTGSEIASSTITNTNLATSSVNFNTINSSAISTTSQFLNDTSNLLLQTDKVWGAAAFTALTDASTVAVDLSTGINFTLTIGGNRTLGNPSNTKAGQCGIIVITQGGGGSNTLAYSSNWKFPGGIAPTLSTAASAVDTLFYTVIDSTHIQANLLNGFA